MNEMRRERALVREVSSDGIWRVSLISVINWVAGWFRFVVSKANVQATIYLAKTKLAK